MADVLSTDENLQENLTIEVENSRLNYGNYNDSDSDCYDHDGNWTSSDSDVETKENSKKRKKAAMQIKSQRSTSNLPVQHTQTDRKSKYMSIDVLKAIYCCACLCLARCTTSMIAEVSSLREQIMPLSRLQFKQWVIDYLNLHKQENLENGTVEFLFMVGTTAICLDAWLHLVGLPLSSFYKIRQMVLNGVKYAPASLGRLHRWDTKTYAAMSWFSQFAAKYGDYQPDSTKLHLPMCLMTKTSVYGYMAQEMRDLGEEEIISLSHFLKLWGEHMQHICLPKVSKFSQCDKCIRYKKMLEKSISNLERDYWRGKRGKHLRKQKLQRDKYAKHASKSKNQPKDYLSLILDGMDQNKTAVPHFSTHSKTTAGIWKLKVHLTGAIHHGVGILGFFDVGQFKHDSNLTISVLISILKNLSCYPPVLYLQMDNCWKDNKNRFILGFLSLLVKLGVFRKVKLGFLMVGHTHEDVDRVFSRFSKALRHNAAQTLEGLNALWKQSQTPSPKGFIIDHSRNVSGWLAPHLDTIQQHSRPHCFKMVKNVQGNVVISWKKWATDKEWVNAGQLLKEEPTGEPEIVTPVYDKVLIKKLEEDIKKAAEFLDEDSKEWWGEFFKGVRIQETELDVPPWELPNLIKRVEESRRTQNVSEEIDLQFDPNQSDEDDPIPPVIIGRKKRR